MTVCVIFANLKLPGFGGRGDIMTRKEFLKRSGLYISGLIFAGKTKLFAKIFNSSKRDLKEARFYKIMK